MSFLSIDRPMHLAARATKYRGVWLAIVMENKDAAPDNQGYHIKITIPHLSEDEKTFWARIAVPMGGKGRGTFQLPEVNDQLLVVFEHGDLHRPIIIGALHSNTQQPPEKHESGKNNTKMIKSRSGHRIIFDDKDGSERVTIVDSKQNQIILDSVKKVVSIISKTGDIEIKAKANVILHANALKVGTSEGITAKGKDVLVHATSSLGIKASAEIVISGSQVQTNVVNSPAAQVSGSGAGDLGGVG
jgi:uncharacterized protein involved in type VI secretion and phage assembly